MKISKVLIISFLFTSSFLAITPAKASTLTTTKPTVALFSSLTDFLNGLLGLNTPSSTGTGSSSTSTSSTSTGGSSSASLPIDNNIWFLVIASAAVGCKVIINKSKVTAQTLKA